jgi:hypothetical protein
VFGASSGTIVQGTAGVLLNLFIVFSLACVRGFVEVTALKGDKRMGIYFGVKT